MSDHKLTIRWRDEHSECIGTCLCGWQAVRLSEGVVRKLYDEHLEENFAQADETRRSRVSDDDDDSTPLVVAGLVSNTGGSDEPVPDAPRPGFEPGGGESGGAGASASWDAGSSGSDTSSGDSSGSSSDGGSSSGGGGGD